MQSLTRVVNINREPYDVFIGRPSLFGNPFRIGQDGTRYQVIDRYRGWFINRMLADEAFRSETEKLKGKVLGCYCRPLACHGEVIAAWCNGDLDV